MGNTNQTNIFTKSLNIVTSPGFALFLFGLLTCFLVPLSFLNEQRSLLLLPVKVVLALISLQLGMCTFIKWKTLKRSTLVIHLGSIIVLVGGFISTFGFVATVNIYEGGETDTVFSWKTKQDVELGYELRVASINMDFHPVGVKIGVMKNGQKADLIETRTGESFIFDNYRVQVDRLDPFERIAHLSLKTNDGTLVGTLSTDGRRRLPLDFHLDFVLVAFQDPNVKRMWVDLDLLRKGELLTSGTSEVNHPLRFQGMKFFLTQIAFDDAGHPYAGIQISRDPGVVYVYIGFVVLCLGLLFNLNHWIVLFKNKNK